MTSMLLIFTKAPIIITIFTDEETRTPKGELMQVTKLKRKGVKIIRIQKESQKTGFTVCTINHRAKVLS